MIHDDESYKYVRKMKEEEIEGWVERWIVDDEDGWWIMRWVEIPSIIIFMLGLRGGGGFNT